MIAETVIRHKEKTVNRTSNDLADCFFEEHYRFLSYYFKKQNIPADDIPDLIQTVYLVFWSRQRQINPGKTQSFLYGIANNILRAYKRKKSTLNNRQYLLHANIIQSLYLPPQSLYETLYCEDLVYLIHMLLLQLPANYSKIIVMRYFQHKTQNEVAHIMKVSQPAVAKAEKHALTILNTLFVDKQT